MSAPRKQIVIGLLAVAVVASASWWSWQFLEDQRLAAIAAAQEAAACEQLADQIIAQRDAGVSAGASRRSQPVDLTNRIARAAGEAGIPARCLDRIENDAPHHALRGDDLEKPTRLVLRDVTLRQFLTVLAKTDDPALGLRVERIRVTTPADARDSGAWSAEATFVQTLPAQTEANSARR